MINRSRPGHCADIDKNANIGLEDWTKGVEEPAVRVDLFLVLLLQAEQNLNGYVAAIGPLNGKGGGIDGH